MKTHTVFIVIGYASLVLGLLFYFVSGGSSYAPAFIVDAIAFLLLGYYLRWKSRHPKKDISNWPLRDCRLALSGQGCRECGA